MGVGWRRFTERLHQSAPLQGSGGLQPTSNERCSSMLKEAAAFTQQLKRCERAIRSMAGANAEAVSTIKQAMLSPLPRRWEETAAAAGGAMPALQTIGGSAFSGDILTSGIQDAGHKTETEVLAPLQRWQEVHLQLTQRFRELEQMRLEVDSRRRTVAELTRRVDGQRARLAKGSDARQEAGLQESIKQLQHKEGKLQVSNQTFVEQERLLHRDLSTLVSDAAWLKHYVAAALRLQGHSLLVAAEAFGPLPGGSPPPASKLAATVGGPAAAPALKGGSGAAGGGATAAAYPAAPASGGLPAASPFSGSGTLQPETPAAGAQQPPMARFPTIEGKY